MSLPAAAERPTVIVGVAGGIAAFKALEVVRRLSETGHDVHVIPTLSALRFVGKQVLLRSVVILYTQTYGLMCTMCPTSVWPERHKQ